MPILVSLVHMYPNERRKESSLNLDLNLSVAVLAVDRPLTLFIQWIPSQKAGAKKKSDVNHSLVNRDFFAPDLMTVSISHENRKKEGMKN